MLTNIANLSCGCEFWSFFYLTFCKCMHAYIHTTYIWNVICININYRPNMRRLRRCLDWQPHWTRSCSESLRERKKFPLAARSTGRSDSHIYKHTLIHGGIIFKKQKGICVDITWFRWCADNNSAIVYTHWITKTSVESQFRYNRGIQSPGKITTLRWIREWMVYVYFSRIINLTCKKD